MLYSREILFYNQELPLVVFQLKKFQGQSKKLLKIGIPKTDVCLFRQT